MGRDQGDMGITSIKRRQTMGVRFKSQLRMIPNRLALRVNKPALKTRNTALMNITIRTR